MMEISPWSRRIRRAQELVSERPFAAEILHFYVQVARTQEELHDRLSRAAAAAEASVDRQLGQAELSELASNFGSFLSVAEAHGPKTLSELSRELRARGPNFWSELLSSAWTTHSPSEAQGFLALAFLQPYAELLRSRATPRGSPHACAICPICNRKPGVGALRQMGDGGARSLICTFCVNEWQFRRIVCPGCGEENEKRLPVFTASEFDYIRMECCDSCKTYLKTVDLTRNGHAEPMVDELASAPLDLWARDRGYARLQKNIFGM